MDVAGSEQSLEMVEAGELDVALIPVIEYFREGKYTIVPGISIASRGPVLSVTLFSRVPWGQVRRGWRSGTRRPSRHR